MEMVSLGLMGVGCLISVVCGIWLLVIAFTTHILWGLAYLFVPFAGLVFVIMHWSKAAKPFLINMLGVGLLVGGVAMSPDMQKALQQVGTESNQAVPASSTTPEAAPQ